MELVRRLVGKGKEAAKLVLEVEIKGAMTDACRLGNVLRTRFMISTLGKQLTCGLHELAAAF